MTYSEYEQQIANSNDSTVVILDRHLFNKSIPNNINKLAQEYNYNNKILKTHSSYYNF